MNSKTKNENRTRVLNANERETNAWLHSRKVRAVTVGCLGNLHHIKTTATAWGSVFNILEQKCLPLLREKAWFGWEKPHLALYAVAVWSEFGRETRMKFQSSSEWRDWWNGNRDGRCALSCSPTLKNIGKERVGMKAENLNRMRWSVCYYRSNAYHSQGMTRTDNSD